ncbi:MAG: hypothetical protein GTO45_12025 [Candidatus Aminicenantes bacterium]|nr:hypothetical protein [Candidatus Aminicenantes bacterium]NIM79522.1 hypothetical protein [Candidatus Aminicenantes bacterium]NIN18836.1 hypothetical protein [Candidatus Aminicenantes bacterium]NIN42749.1 hypothetical protein [Candidatus Aminicenantes bacterium]NIN85476.1 hypothetical protein [Candidatus Aminicenantes bacterium]
MKSRTLKKKLSLNKTTIANMNEKAMDKVRGGTATLLSTCCITAGLSCTGGAACHLPTFCACTIGGPNCPR